MRLWGLCAGSIPRELGGLTRVTSFGLSNNQLSGEYIAEAAHVFGRSASVCRGDEGREGGNTPRAFLVSRRSGRKAASCLG